MSNRSERSPSPMVFVRHPHCFVPVSGQNISPPPNWKPPPLPTDVHEGSEKQFKMLPKAKTEETVSNDSGYLSLPSSKNKKGQH